MLYLKLFLEIQLHFQFLACLLIYRNKKGLFELLQKNLFLSVLELTIHLLREAGRPQVPDSLPFYREFKLSPSHPEELVSKQ